MVPRERGVVAGSDRARQRLLVLGAGPAQLGLLARRARARPLRDRRRPRPGRARLRATPTSARSSRARTSPASTGSPRRSGSTAMISPGADWPVGIAARVAERLGLPHPIDAGDGGARDDEVAPARAVRRGGRAAAARCSRSPRRRASSRRPTGRASAGSTLVRTEDELAGAIEAARGRVAERHLHRRGVRRRARGDGERASRSTASSTRCSSPTGSPPSRPRSGSRSRTSGRCVSANTKSDRGRDGAAAAALGIAERADVHADPDRRGRARSGRTGGAARRRPRRRALPRP